MELIMDRLLSRMMALLSVITPYFVKSWVHWLETGEPVSFRSTPVAVTSTEPPQITALGAYVLSSRSKEGETLPYEHFELLKKIEESDRIDKRLSESLRGLLLTSRLNGSFDREFTKVYYQGILGERNKKSKGDVLEILKVLFQDYPMEEVDWE